MPKDNETVPALSDGPAPDPPRSFESEQMVRCDACSRSNSPTRSNCLYCGAALAVTPGTIAAPKPSLRPLEKWEQGYNNIVLPPAANLSDSFLSELANFLRLETEDLKRILLSDVPLPVARSSSKAEAELIQTRLEKAQLNSLIVADTSLGIEPPVKVRALKFHDDGLDLHQSQQAAPHRISWNAIVLIASGRITRKRVEVTEEKTRGESRMLEADQFFADETVVDLYEASATTPYRIAANGFDFSCLHEKKRLVAAENMLQLIEVLRERAPAVNYDQTYNKVRKALETVWQSDQQSESMGWRRARPGKLSLGSATETSNESQFSRYSRLRYYLVSQQPAGVRDV